MTEADKILVEILAMTDALFAPLRQNFLGTYALTNVYLGQREFAEDGRPWRSGKRGGASVEAGRALSSLQEQGLLSIVSRTSQRFPFVKLTLRGDNRARKLAGLPGMTAALEFMRDIVTRAIDPLNWLHERALATDEHGTQQIDVHDLWAVQAMALPALVRGLAEGHSNGSAFFRLTREGLKYVHRHPEPDEPEFETGGDDEYEFYRDAFSAERVRLMEDKPTDPREIGSPFLSACCPWNAKPPWGYPGPPIYPDGKPANERSQTT